MALTGAQLRQFQMEGYTIIPDFFNAREVAAFRSELERLQNIGKLRNVATAGDGKTRNTQGRNLQLCPMSPHSNLFRALPFVPKVVQTLTQLIGDPLILHLDQVFLKPARDGLGTNWHQDNAYFKINNPMQGSAMWIAVHDATVANGTIRVIPNAYQQPLPHSRDPMSDHHVRCYPDESKALTCEVPAGGAVFFCYGTPHATGANTTDHDRAGLAFHFLTQEALDTISQESYFKKTGEYHPYLSGPKASGGLQEYGVKIEGTWEQELSRVVQKTSSTFVTHPAGR